MYMYLEYKSTATIGQWWNVSNHSGYIQIDTVANKGNNPSLLCDYITKCNYHSSYFSQILNCSRSHYFTAGESFWNYVITQYLTKQYHKVYLWLLQRSNLFTIEKVPTDIDCIPITE